MSNITVESLDKVPAEQQRVELVERKGVGHPDSICDAIMEAISVALCGEYMATFGRIVHHNIDKGLLVADITSPKIGGGTVDEPMKLVFGGRSIYETGGKRVPVGEIAEMTAKKWLTENVRFVDPDEHVIYQNEIKEGSLELTGIFEREKIGANDTSAAAGYAPLTETEGMVLTHFMADEIYKSVPGIREVYVWLCSQIGQSIEEPLIASAQLILKDNISLASIQRDVEAVIAQESAHIYEFTDRLTKGE